MPRKPKTFRPRGTPTPQQQQREYNRHGRDKALAAIYWSSRWKKFTAIIKAERLGLCEVCKANGRVVVGVIIHHLQDPRDAPDLTFDEENVQLVCRPCHNRIHASDKRG